MLLVLLLFFSQFNWAQVGHPPVLSENILFFMQKDADTVVYLLNFDLTGQLNHEKPVTAIWLKDLVAGKTPTFYRKPPPSLYGFHCKKIAGENFEIKLNACKKIPLYLKRVSENGKYQIYIREENREYLLKRIYMRVASRKGKSAQVQHLDLVTVNSLSGIEFLKRINI